MLQTFVIYAAKYVLIKQEITVMKLVNKEDGHVKYEI